MAFDRKRTEDAVKIVLRGPDGKVKEERQVGNPPKQKNTSITEVRNVQESNR